MVLNMPDSFDLVEKAAVAHAREIESTPFKSLIQGFVYNDPAMAFVLLRFINQMIHNAADEMKQARFIAKLEILGIFDLLRKWGESDIEDITSQIEVLLIYLNKMSEN